MESRRESRREELLGRHSLSAQLLPGRII